MEIVYFLLPASLVLVICGLAGYIWAVRAGQFDDLETPRWKVLSDDVPCAPEKREGEERGRAKEEKHG